MNGSSMMSLPPLIPAKAGIQLKKNGDASIRPLSGKDWIPASAGMSGSVSMRVLAVIITLITLALTPTPSHAQGFSGLGADAGGFAQVVPGKQLVFPADHGAHPDYRIEWWYLTANLKDAQGN